MAVEHLVWFKFNEDVSDERIEHHMDGLRSLPGKVPGILELSCGANFTERSKGFTHGLRVKLESKEALAGYGPHPEHQAVAGPIAQEAEIIALDYEIE